LTVREIKQILKAKVPGIRCMTVAGTALKCIAVGTKYSYRIYSSYCNTEGDAWRDAYKYLS